MSEYNWQFCWCHGNHLQHSVANFWQCPLLFNHLCLIWSTRHLLQTVRQPLNRDVTTSGGCALTELTQSMLGDDMNAKAIVRLLSARGHLPFELRSDVE
eukprot:1121422-Amphidinium_carterae.1